VYIIITSDCILYIVIVINDLFWTFLGFNRSSKAETRLDTATFGTHVK
jgi:hypothetical protein